MNEQLDGNLRGANLEGANLKVPGGSPCALTTIIPRAIFTRVWPLSPVGTT